MARIPEDVINNVRNRADIVEIVSHYIPLTRKGKNYMGVCPFHDDHNPSMSVSSDKQIFHCFVCGAGGNAFTFAQRFENISFVESVKRVADIANIPVEIDITTYERPIDTKFQPLHDVLRDAIDFCAYELKSVDAKVYHEYLEKRGLSEEIIDKFGLGYNPKENKLYKFLHAKKHADDDIISTNVCRLSERGISDVFYNRIMIPIHDSYGNPVGFSARDIDGASSAKYINTAETPIYVKGNLLYNFHRAREVARKQQEVIVVEGAMDVLAFEKAGMLNSVATLGTACTEEQIKLLKQLNAKILLFYDGDRAGQEASYKFAKLALSRGLEVELVNNELGLDPDEIVEKHGCDELVLTSQKTFSWIEYLFRYLGKKYNLENYSEKKEFAMLISEEIKQVKEAFERQNYYQKLFDMTGFSFTDEVIKEMPYQQSTTFEKRTLQKPKLGMQNAQFQILSLMLISKQANEVFRSDLGFLPSEHYNNLALIIINYYRNHDTIVVADLLNYINEEEEKKILLEITNWELAPTKFQHEFMQEAISKVKSGLVSEKISRLLEQSNQLSDPIQKAKIADEVIKLRRKRGD